MKWLSKQDLQEILNKKPVPKEGREYRSVVCKGCGGEFKVKAKVSKDIHRKYCTEPCYRKNYKHDYAKARRSFSLTR